MIAPTAVLRRRPRRLIYGDAVIGATLLIAVIAAALLSPWLPLPNALNSNLLEIFLPPGSPGAQGTH
mgnify:FL=1